MMVLPSRAVTPPSRAVTVLAAIFLLYRLFMLVLVVQGKKLGEIISKKATEMNSYLLLVSTWVSPEGRSLGIDVPESNAGSADGVIGPEGAEV